MFFFTETCSRITRKRNKKGVGDDGYCVKQPMSVDVLDRLTMLSFLACEIQIVHGSFISAKQCYCCGKSRLVGHVAYKALTFSLLSPCLFLHIYVHQSANLKSTSIERYEGASLKPAENTTWQS